LAPNAVDWFYEGFAANDNAVAPPNKLIFFSYEGFSPNNAPLLSEMLAPNNVGVLFYTVFKVEDSEFTEKIVLLF
jgi:hypothetical protein